MFDETKALLQSRTFWAALLALLANVAHQFHWAIVYSLSADPATIDVILNTVTQFGVVGAMLFRVLATRRIATVAPKKTP